MSYAFKPYLLSQKIFTVLNSNNLFLGINLTTKSRGEDNGKDFRSLWQPS